MTVRHLGTSELGSAIHPRPPEQGHGLEDLFAEANRRSVATSADLLQSWFPSFPVRRLIQTTDSSTFASGIAATTLLRSPLIAGDPLSQAFDHRSYGAAGLRLVRNREFLPPGTGLVATAGTGRTVVDQAALGAHLTSGYTAVLDGIDLRHEPAMRLAEAAERAFGCAVNINGYLSLRSEPSFGAHWDDQEVIILQLVGAKRWVVEEPLALSMSKASHSPATSGQVVWDGELHVGGALHVPRGWGHRVTSHDGLSFHYTLTIPRQTGVDALSRIAAASGTTRGPSAASSGTTELHRRLDDLAVTGALARAQAAARATVPNRSTQKLTDLQRFRSGAHQEAWARCPLSSGWQVCEGPVNNQEILLRGGGRTVLVGGAHAEVLARHGDGTTRFVHDQPHEAAVIADLAAHGLLDVGYGDPGWGVALAAEA